MRQVAGRTLWLGHAGDLRDPRSVLAAGVEAVIELADSEQPAILPRDLVRCRFPLSDGGDNPSWLLRLAAESGAALLGAGVTTLVCCSAGMSRSVCIAAAAIALADGRPLDETVAEVAASGPADVSPGLLVQLRHALGELVGAANRRNVTTLSPPGRARGNLRERRPVPEGACHASRPHPRPRPGPRCRSDRRRATHPRPQGRPRLCRGPVRRR